jgi:hypothetical protein
MWEEQRPLIYDYFLRKKDHVCHCEGRLQETHRVTVLSFIKMGTIVYLNVDFNDQQTVHIQTCPCTSLNFALILTGLFPTVSKEYAVSLNCLETHRVINLFYTMPCQVASKMISRNFL